jgi:hypothetical protein
MSFMIQAPGVTPIKLFRALKGTNALAYYGKGSF